jgi:4-amino-4-deoxy-L-arabinose transferase-like glycosyltransferase
VRAGAPATGGAPSRASWALLAIALAAVFFWRLGAAPLFDVDEGAFAEATREMISSGDWLHTTLNGADRFDKPILVYWLQAASLLALGKSDAAVRLPSAVCGVLWCLAVARFAAPRFGARAAWAAAAILGTSVGVVAIGRAATADALLNLLLALTAFDLWRHVETGAKAPLRGAALWAALGVLDKGPIALLVPGGTIVVWAVLSRDLKPLGRAIADPVAWLILVGVAAPWYAYALHRHGQAFIDGFVMKHNVRRFTGTLEGHAGGPLYYAIALPLIALPWTPLLFALVPQLKRLWCEPPTRWLLCWSGFVLIFFSLSGTKLPHYVLYGYTPLALLGGRMLADAPSRALRVALWAGFAATLVALCATPWLAGLVAARLSPGLYRSLVEGAAPPSSAYVIAATLAAALVLLAALRSATGAWGAEARAGLGAVAVALFLVAAVVPWWAETLQGPVRRLAEAARAASPGAPAGTQANVNLPSFGWYLEAPAPHRLPTAGELGLYRTDRLKPGAPDTPATIVSEERGLALARP